MHEAMRNQTAEDRQDTETSGQLNYELGEHFSSWMLAVKTVITVHCEFR